MCLNFEMKLFAVYLGGRAPKCNTELHDVVFAVGNSIEDTYEQLLTKWFGDPAKMHIDSWMELDVVDGHAIHLKKEPDKEEKKLFFINLGAYREGDFTEHHTNALLVDTSAISVKKRAKERMFMGYEQVHKDDLMEVDDCLNIADQIEGFFIHLEPTDKNEKLIPNNGYQVLPKEVVSAFLKRN